MVLHAIYRLFLLWVVICHGAFGFQNQALFESEDPIQISLAINISELKNSKSDTVFFGSMLLYRFNNQLPWDSIPVEVRARGNFRRKNCTVPPIRLKTNKEAALGTIFQQNKSLKLVLPCRAMELYNELIVKEYVCYKIYEHISPYHFRTRMVDLTLIDVGKRKTNTYHLKAFLLEDDDDLAKRFQGHIVTPREILPESVEDTTAVRQDFFAFMIGNTDWSNRVQHNVKILQIGRNKYYPLPYDFDNSGFVSAPYAVPNDRIPVKTVQERYYLGYCRDKGLFEKVRNEFLEKEDILKKEIDNFSSGLSPSHFKDSHQYLEEFYAIIKNERLFEMNILKKCRLD
ncbi:hypothetical protein [Shivajiella indica]|uniref:YARHG domain-containing protein n=1 Tax=Shivajiella indica TaxID=872115 RepID=A0ABW5B4E9_9BACT